MLEFMQAWGDFLLGFFQLLLVAIVVPLWRGVAKLRANDLAHIDEKVENIHKAIHGIREEQRLLIERMDRHLEFHVTNAKRG